MGSNWLDDPKSADCDHDWAYSTNKDQRKCAKCNKEEPIRMGGQSFMDMPTDEEAKAIAANICKHEGHAWETISGIKRCHTCNEVEVVTQDKQMCDPEGTAWKRDVTMPCPRCGKPMFFHWTGNTVISGECRHCNYTMDMQG